MPMPIEMRRSCYCVYGVRFPEVATLLGFNGEYQDRVTHSYLLGNGYRAYNPFLMRFSSPDSEAPFGRGGLNAYGFAAGDPVNHRDPSGHAPQQVPTAKRYYYGPVQVIDGLRVFSTEGPSGSKILNIGAHGSAGRLKSDKGAWTAHKVSSRLQEAGINLEGQETHILACRSADINPSTGTSFIQDMASITRAPSKGYQGNMWVDDNRPLISNGTFEKYWLKVPTALEPDHKDFARFTYSPVTVFPDGVGVIRENQ